MASSPSFIRDLKPQHFTHVLTQRAVIYFFTMVSIRSNNSFSPPRTSRSTTTQKLIVSCRLLFLGAACIALFKIDSNKTQLDDLILNSNERISTHTNTPVLRSLRQDYGESCRLYLAESTFPNGGLGVFAAQGILPHHQVGMDDVCILVEHLPPHSETQLRTHTWGSANVFGQFEVSRKKGKAKAACEGLGTLYNAAPPELAAVHKISPHHHDNGGLTRTQHPGAGAISHYYGMTGIANDLIPAGSELTVNYGDWQFNEDEIYVKPKRNVEWIRQYGMCVDNIEVQTATDPEMGRGAFATRFLPRGTIVSPAPLQLTKRRSAFDYDPTTEVEPLFVNYNFYVGEMLLFPYGPGVNLINHSSKNPNVGLQWSSSKFHHTEWLQLSLDELWTAATPGGLILEVVALRDIQPGEELFLNYGKEWEAAWNRHVQTWKPVKGASEYVYPASMDETAPLRTVEELKTNPYPSNLMTVCETPDETRSESRIVKWYPKYEFPFRMVVCHVLERTENKHGDDVYKVMLDWDGIEYDESIPEQKRYIDYNVPRKAIRFVDKPNQSDQRKYTWSDVCVVS